MGNSADNGKITVGATAPDFSLPDDSGNTVSLCDYRGQNVILYFYPAASTPGCTREANDFQQALPELAEAGYAVIGVSPDDQARIAKFRADGGFEFPLLSDPERDVLSEWGAYGEKKVYGKTVLGVIRSTFVIDPSGVVTNAMYNVKATGHVAKVRREIGV